mmetsp:Transcript_127297/g.407481  ORF Transcript_127297/g.407481 Transcript_127297/m.407481 type:complete len:419 (-) Transcript_127297:1419-2675(-)
MFAFASAMQALGLGRLRCHPDAKPYDAEDHTAHAELLSNFPRVLEVFPLVDLLPVQLDDAVAHLPPVLLHLPVDVHDHDATLVLVGVIQSESQSAVRQRLLDRDPDVRLLLDELGSAALLPLRAQKPLHRCQRADVGVAQTIRIVVVVILGGGRLFCVAVLLVLQLLRPPKLADHGQHILCFSEHLSEGVLVVARPDLPATLDAFLPLGRRSDDRQSLFLISCSLILPTLQFFEHGVFNIADECCSNIVTGLRNTPQQQGQNLLHEGLDPRCVYGACRFSASEVDEQRFAALPLHHNVLDWVHHHDIVPNDRHHRPDHLLRRSSRSREIRPTLANQVDTIHLVHAIRLIARQHRLGNVWPRNNELVVGPNFHELLDVRQPQLRDQGQAPDLCLEGHGDAHLLGLLWRVWVLHFQNHEV